VPIVLLNLFNRAVAELRSDHRQRDALHHEPAGIGVPHGVKGHVGDACGHVCCSDAVGLLGWSPR
jgi:hypothetical protein